jgi:antitoxin HigA-1
MLVPTDRRPITPGDVLREDFLEPLGLTQAKVAQALGVDRTSLNELINGRRDVTTEMALRLGHAFRTSAQYWLNLQTAVDLFDAQQSEVAAAIQRQRVLVTMKAPQVAAGSFSQARRKKKSNARRSTKR